MALNGVRMVLYLFGTILVLAGLWMLLAETGLAKWVPTGLLVAGVLLIVGMAVMGFAEHAPAEHEHGHDDDGDVTVVRH
jgi:NADH:ubiquinone oxidoreductase subunit 6 (subunit J)